VRKRRGTSLVELIVAIGLGFTALSAGYGAYYRFACADDYEAKREAIGLTANNLIRRIKQDVRAASSVNGSGNVLALTVRGKQITYQNLPVIGVKRITRDGRWTVRGVNASFTSSGRGVRISIRADKMVQRRPLKFNVTSFVMPRN
jgi:hypothetical protein